MLLVLGIILWLIWWKFYKKENFGNKDSRGYTNSKSNSIGGSNIITTTSTSSNSTSRSDKKTRIIGIILAVILTPILVGCFLLYLKFKFICMEDTEEIYINKGIMKGGNTNAYKKWSLRCL